MTLTVNETTLNAVLNGGGLKKEMISVLSQVIDDEFQKDEIDCTLIEECVETIDAVQQEDVSSAFKLIVTKRQILRYCKRKTASAKWLKSVVAAVLVLTVSSYTALSVSPAFADSVKNFFDEVVSSLFSLAEDTEGTEDIVSIYVTVPDALFEQVTGIDSIDLSRAEITAIYQNGTEKAVPIEQCKISKSIEQNGEKRYVLAVIAYQGCSCSIAFEMEA